MFMMLLTKSGGPKSHYICLLLATVCSTKHLKGILLVGNVGTDGTVELYDPSSGGTKLQIEGLDELLYGGDGECSGLYRVSDNRFLIVSTKDTYYLDLCTKKAEPGPKLTTRRYDAASTRLDDDTVLVCGGKLDKSLKSCERLIGNEWIELYNNMTVAPHSFSMTAVGTVVIAAGGLIDGVDASDVSLLESGVWTEGGTLFICGGAHASSSSMYNTYMASCEQYSGGGWREAPRLNREREYFAMVLYDGKWFVLGGYQGYGKYLDSVEVFDSGVFVEVKQKMNVGRARHCATAVDVNCPDVDVDR